MLTQGRGIVIGRSKRWEESGHCITLSWDAVRIAVIVSLQKKGEGNPHTGIDPAKLEDPSLIIYAPVRVLGDETIVTNGDQTDTVYEGREKGLTFEESLRSREFEPDGPNYTPRISGLMKIKDGTFHYAMSILKSNNGNPESCNRFTYTYENPIAGEGRLSTHICMMGIHFQVLKENLNQQQSKKISMTSQIHFGTA